MASYDVKRIEVLFSLCLAKSKAERNRVGFDKLSHSLNESKDISSPEISQKYLDENVHKQLSNCIEINKEIIGLKHDYVQVLTNFVEFDSYDQFSDCYDEVLTIVGRDELTSIHFFCEENKEEKTKSFISEFSYPGQEHPTNISFSTLPEKLNFKSAKESMHLQILIASHEWIEQQQLEIQTSSEDTPILYFHSDETGQVEFKKLSKMELGLIYQMLSHNVSQESSLNEDHRKIKTGSSQTTHIHDSGAINLGTIGSIKAKYISSRDMHINIKKKK